MTALAHIARIQQTSRTRTKMEEAFDTSVEIPPMYLGSSIEGRGLRPNWMKAAAQAPYTAATMSRTDASGVQPRIREVSFMVFGLMPNV